VIEEVPHAQYDGLDLELKSGGGYCAFRVTATTRR
jgi:hypothetical protein